MLIIGQNIDNEMMLCFQPILTTEEGGDTQLWSIDQEGHISPWLEPNLVLLVTAGEVMLGRRGGGQDNSQKHATPHQWDTCAGEALT